WGASDVWRMEVMPCRSFETDTRCRPRVGGCRVCCSRRCWRSLCLIPARPLRRRQNRSSSPRNIFRASSPPPRTWRSFTRPPIGTKVEARAAAVAKKSGFASLDEYDDASMNISMIMSGIDPQTKKFTEPPEQIRKEIAALKADKSVSEAEKKEDLAQLEA